MIILFNTAYRPGYLRNMLRTIFLPVGAKNQYRYTIGRNISEKDVSAIRQKGESQRVLICFGDRFSEGGYTFHPVRYGKLDSIELAGGRVYFRVRLERHVSCASAAEFTTALYSLAAEEGQDPPRLTGGEAKNPKDGTYAISISSSDLADQLEATELSWSSTAHDLAKTKAFSGGARYVFAKCDLIVDGHPKHYSADGHLPRYEVDRDKDARIAVSYIFPAQDDGGNSAVLTLTAPPGMQLLGQATQILDMPENRLEFPFVVEPGSEKNFFSVDVSIKSAVSGSAEEIVGPGDALAFRVHDPIWRTLLAVVSLAVYVVGAWFSGAGPENSSLGEVLKTLGIVGMFFALRGKRIV